MRLRETVVDLCQSLELEHLERWIAILTSSPGATGVVKSENALARRVHAVSSAGSLAVWKPRLDSVLAIESLSYELCSQPASQIENS